MVLYECIWQINLICVVIEVEDFVDLENVEQMLGGGCFDYVIDVIDNVLVKVVMIVWCCQNGMFMVIIGSVGGQIDLIQIEICDLCCIEQELLLVKVCKCLCLQYGFLCGIKNKFYIDVVFFIELLCFLELVEGEVCEIVLVEDVGEDVVDSM